jgi:hypothetical protein
MSIPESSTPMNQPPVTPNYQRDSSLAVASLICGIASWFIIPFVGAIVAIITGHIAKKEIRESNGALSGNGMALAGLILGYIQIGFIVIGVACLLTVIFVAANGATHNLIGPSASILNLI